jgi:putative transposase
MPRISRAMAVDLPHHITQRGNYRHGVFEKEGDYLQYLEWLTTYSRKYLLKIWAYCLMENHVHFIAVPMDPGSIGRTFNTLHMRYAQYIKRRRNGTGHLWQGRFFSCVLDKRHLYTAMRYVENNPVRANITKKADEYRWSSARRHVRGTVDPVLSNDCYMHESVENWSAYLEQKEDSRQIEAIRENTRTGRPWGDEAFVLRIEELLQRVLNPMPRGGTPKASTLKWALSLF